jgi:hypothetical protein
MCINLAQRIIRNTSYLVHYVDLVIFYHNLTEGMYMTYFLSKKSSGMNRKDYTPPPPLVLPVAIKDGHKYLSVDMSSGDKGEWAEVDFTRSDYAGIYTDSLSFCSALTIIKKDDAGNIEKAWMLHLSGGFNVDQMKDLPEPWDSHHFEMIGKYGTSDPQDQFYQGKDESDIAKILERYQDKGVIRGDIKLFTTLNYTGSMAINRYGYIGLKPDSLPVSGIDGERHTVIADSRTSPHYFFNYKTEKQRFQQLIKISPLSEKNKLDKVYNSIILHNSNDELSTAKALVYTRHFICSPKTESLKSDYHHKMRSIGPSWTKVALLAVATLCLPAAVYTVPKLITFFQNAKKRDELERLVTDDEHGLDTYTGPTKINDFKSMS